MKTVKQFWQFGDKTLMLKAGLKHNDDTNSLAWQLIEVDDIRKFTKGIAREQTSPVSFHRHAGIFTMVHDGNVHRGHFTANDRLWLHTGGHTFCLEPVHWHAGNESHGELTSQMPGKVIAVEVKEGDHVSQGQTVMILEAMKMEHAVKAPADAVVAKLHVETGQQIGGGITLVDLDYE